MDLIAYGWEGNQYAIGTAEGLAARVPGAPETCAGGTGVGACERESALLNEACKDKVKSLTPPRGTNSGTFTLGDSGYTISSDGQGPYRIGTANVGGVIGGVGNVLVLRETRTGPARTFTVDLSRPVPGDIGVPLGQITADATRQRPFVPAATNYSLELGAGYVSNDTTLFTGDIPVGSTVRGGVFINFYVSGLLHVLAIGPPLPGSDGTLCGTYGSAVHGVGTTAVLISRPTATSWVVHVPPGSIGRLFDSSREERNAVNRGLYYVSLRGVWEQ